MWSGANVAPEGAGPHLLLVFPSTVPRMEGMRTEVHAMAHEKHARAKCLKHRRSDGLPEAMRDHTRPERLSGSIASWRNRSCAPFVSRGSHPPSFLFSNSFTLPGFAFPPDAFLTWPT